MTFTPSSTFPNIRSHPNLETGDQKLGYENVIRQGRIEDLATDTDITPSLLEFLLKRYSVVEGNRKWDNVDKFIQELCQNKTIYSHLGMLHMVWEFARWMEQEIPNQKNMWVPKHRDAPYYSNFLRFVIIHALLTSKKTDDMVHPHFIYWIFIQYTDMITEDAHPFEKDAWRVLIHWIRMAWDCHDFKEWIASINPKMSGLPLSWILDLYTPEQHKELGL